ncbi:MAG: hypothetical protein WB762_23885 [Candidatus Sulfotelmatobacter sp.]
MAAAGNTSLLWIFDGDNRITTSTETLPDALIPTIDPATGKAPSAGATYAFGLPTLAADRNVVFWIDTFVPRGTGAGNYTGT